VQINSSRYLQSKNFELAGVDGLLAKVDSGPTVSIKQIKLSAIHGLNWPNQIYYKPLKAKYTI